MTYKLCNKGSYIWTNYKKTDNSIGGSSLTCGQQRAGALARTWAQGMKTQSIHVV